MDRYNKFSEALFERYGEKVYKIPIKIDGTCPNRGPNKTHCIYCGEEGGSFENLSPTLSVKEQLDQNIETIRAKYNANKYIAYFQNFTNTYVKRDRFYQMIQEAIQDDIVAIYISTRPDCLLDEQLSFLENLKKTKNIDIVMELGLQTANYKSLIALNRGHTLAEFVQAVNRCHQHNLEVCAHVIIGLPWDDEFDVIETAKILSVLNVEQVKIHALYIMENTKLGELYQCGEFEIISRSDYVERVILFLRYLKKESVVQRLIGRSPEEGSLFSNWGKSWWRIQDEIIEKMTIRDYIQGDCTQYLIPKEKI